MPTLVRPSINADTRVTQANPQGSTTAALNIANVASQVGGELSKLGQTYLDKAQQSLSTSVYTVHMNKAMDRFNEATKERQQNLVDEHGNPTTGTMAQDVQKAGEQILSEQGAFIADEQAFRQFQQDFRNNIDSQVARTATFANKKEGEFALAATSEAVNKAIEVSVDQGDFETANRELSRIKRIIATQVDAGRITPLKSQEMMDSAGSTVMKSLWTEKVKEDPEAVIEYLKGDRNLEQLGIEEAGLSKRQKEQFIDLAEQTKNYNELERKRIIEEYSGKVSDWQAGNKEKAENAIRKGTITTVGELDQMVGSGHITIKGENELISTLRSVQNDATNRAVAIRNVSEALANGDQAKLNALNNDVMGIWYNDQVASIMTGNRNISPVEAGTQAVAKAGRPIKSHTNQLENLANAEDPQRVLEGYKSYSNLSRNRNTAKTLGGLDERAQSLYSRMEARGVSSVEEAKSVINTWNEIQKKTDVQIKELENRWDNDTEDLDFEEVLRDEFEDIGLETRGTFSEDTKFAPGIKTQYRQVVRRNFIANGGDLKAAKIAARNNFLPTIGKTRVLQGRYNAEDAEKQEGSGFIADTAVGLGLTAARSAIDPLGLSTSVVGEFFEGHPEGTKELPGDLERKVIQFPPDEVFNLGENGVRKFNTEVVKGISPLYKDGKIPDGTKFNLSIPKGGFTTDGVAYQITAISPDQEQKTTIITFNQSDFTEEQIDVPKTTKELIKENRKQNKPGQFIPTEKQREEHLKQSQAVQLNAGFLGN